MRTKVLYLDDDEHCLAVFVASFAGEYDVRAARTPPEARSVLSGWGAEIIISDQNMPGMSGRDFLGEAAHLYPTSYRVLLTGASFVGDFLPDLSSGAIHSFLRKPWATESVHRAVESALLRNLRHP